jgi:hypothetical protein
MPALTAKQKNELKPAPPVQQALPGLEVADTGAAIDGP